MKDFDYYNGEDIVWPTRPIKPILDKTNVTAEKVREYADKLEEYEKKYSSYNKERKCYEDERKNRLDEFKRDLEEEYASEWMNRRVLNLVYNRAWEESHHSGLHEVADTYSEIVDFLDDIYNCMGVAE